jgi:hypothetical protein
MMAKERAGFEASVDPTRSTAADAHAEAAEPIAAERPAAPRRPGTAQRTPAIRPRRPTMSSAGEPAPAAPAEPGTRYTAPPASERATKPAVRWRHRLPDPDCWPSLPDDGWAWTDLSPTVHTPADLRRLDSEQRGDPWSA